MKIFFRLLLLTVFVVGISLVRTNLTNVAAADAASIFAAKCAKCHGQDGAGVEKYLKKGMKSFRENGWQKSRSDAQLTASINNGKGEAMQPWKGKLSADEIKSLVGLVRSFGK